MYVLGDVFDCEVLELWDRRVLGFGGHLVGTGRISIGEEQISLVEKIYAEGVQDSQL